MFCYQCQEAAKGTGCTSAGVCGKTNTVANYQDLLIYTLKGLSIYTVEARKSQIDLTETNNFIIEGLFSTITNANFDKGVIIDKIKLSLKLRDKIKNELISKNIDITSKNHDSLFWDPKTDEEYEIKSMGVGILSTQDEDIRSLRELLVYGIKGMAAYAKHAENLGYQDEEIHEFIQRGLASTTDDTLSADELVSLVMECGKNAVTVMALLDEANTTTYGNPEITTVNLGVRNNPAILISGHDLKDMEQLLKQTQGTGVDVYTHSEMLPANYYPEFKKYDHFVGNYGNAWWKQKEEFEKFNGPILLTTNCLVPPKESYKDRVYTTGEAGFPDVKHIEIDEKSNEKDFSEIIELAKRCEAPEEIEKGVIVGGFAHKTVISLADKVIEAVKNGNIKQFFVMAGCDGRMKSRDYYSEFATELPDDTVILTAGCAKYRYNKLDLGDINGIPRVLDAGQCNDSYSLAVIALKLKEAFGLEDINELPISYNIAWYEQKAVTVLLALLYLGVKKIKLGPSLPAFLSPNVAKILVETFGISAVNNVQDDMDEFLKGGKESASSV